MSTAAFEAVVDAAIELEFSLIGGMVANDAVASIASDILLPDHFAHSMTSVAFKHAQEIVQRDGRISMQVLVSRCAASGGPSSADVANWVSCTSVVPMNALSTIDEIIDNWARRSLIEAGVSAQDAAAAGDQPYDVSRILMDQCDAIQTSKSRRVTHPLPIGKVAERALTAASEAYEAGGNKVDISWGLKDLDRRTNGLRRKDFVLVGGRPSMGKTVLATSVLRQAAHAGHGCALFSLEMGSEAITTRMLSDEGFGFSAPTKYSDVFAGSFTEGQFKALADAQQRMAQLPIAIDDQRGLTVAEIASRARRIKNQFEAAGKRLDVVAIDYLGLVRPSSVYRGQRVNEIGDISSGLKAMAQDLDCCVICLQQLSRQVEQRENKRPTLADLRDSGTLEQDADIVAFVYRDEYYAARTEPTTESERLAIEDRLERSKNVMEFIIAKQRNGAVGTVNLFADVSFAAVRDPAR
jgi:replicative DNA helicase